MIKTNVYKHKFLKANPDYFSPEGITIFCRCTTDLGKTLSMVKAVKKVLKDFPKAILVSNIEIKGVENTKRLLLQITFNTRILLRRRNKLE